MAAEITKPRDYSRRNMTNGQRGSPSGLTFRVAKHFGFSGISMFFEGGNPDQLSVFIILPAGLQAEKAARCGSYCKFSQYFIKIFRQTTRSIKFSAVRPA
jgi:hypothetical protein